MLPQWLSGKESTCSAGDSGDVGLIPGSDGSPGGGNGNPLQYSCLSNVMDRGAGGLQSIGSPDTTEHTRMRQDGDLNSIFFHDKPEKPVSTWARNQGLL